MKGSVEFNQCFCENEEILVEIKGLLCTQCGRFSNPQWKNSKANIHYCVMCQKEVDLSDEYSMISLNGEKYICLKVFCENKIRGCCQVFNTEELHNLKEHQNSCHFMINRHMKEGNTMTTLEVKKRVCGRCDIKYVGRLKDHDCFKEFGRILGKQGSRILSLEEDNERLKERANRVKDLEREIAKMKKENQKKLDDMKSELDGNLKILYQTVKEKMTKFVKTEQDKLRVEQNILRETIVVDVNEKVKDVNIMRNSVGSDECKMNEISEKLCSIQKHCFDLNDKQNIETYKIKEIGEKLSSVEKQCLDLCGNHSKSSVSRDSNPNKEIRALTDSVVSAVTYLFFNVVVDNVKIYKTKGKNIYVDFLYRLENLNELSLDFQDNAISVEGSGALAEALVKLKPLTILSLNLNKSEISYQGTKCLSSALSNLTNLSNLSLVLENNDIKDAGCKELGNALSNLTLLQQLYLNLNVCGLSMEGMEHLGPAFKIITNLKKLVFSLNGNKIYGKGVMFLQAGCEKLTQLEYFDLDLYGNLIDEIYLGNTGTFYLASMIIRMSKLNYMNLNLRCNTIARVGCEALKQALNRLVNLTDFSLDLFGNKIKAEGAKLLGNGLEKMSKLEILKINLDNGEIKEGVKDLFNKVKDLKKLFRLDISLERNVIETDHTVSIIESLLMLPNLNYIKLHLKYNQINEKGLEELKKFAAVFRKRENVTFICNLDGNQIPNHLSTKI